MQKALEEFTVLVEVLDGVGMVGAGAIHELVEVVRQALLGLLARSIGRGDQRGVCRSAMILLVLFVPLHGGALVLVLMLVLALVPASIEDHSDHVLARGVVHGDVEQVVGGMGLQATKLVDQGLIGCPGEECTNDIYTDDIREGVASLGESADVIL